MIILYIDIDFHILRISKCFSWRDKTSIVYRNA